MINKIAIVLPCYNEGKRFSPDILLTELTSLTEIDFLFVNDGSTDNTARILDTLSTKTANVNVLHLKKNLGKAEAVRAGVLSLLSGAKYSHIGYLDADFATPLNQLHLFLDHLPTDRRHQILFGSRIKRAGASIDRNQFRHYSGRIVATIVNNSIVKIPVYDTQCGAKIMTVALAKEIFKDRFVSKWLFDIELIARLQQIYPLDEVLEMVYEVPLTVWIEEGETKIKFEDVLLVPYHLMKIRLRYKLFAKAGSNKLEELHGI